MERIPRFYYPRYKTTDEIVRLAGFTPAKHGMGYERNVQEEGRYRLHATTHGGRIDIHWDEPIDDDRHKIKRQHPAIAEAHADFARADLQGVPAILLLGDALANLLGLRRRW